MNSELSARLSTEQLQAMRATIAHPDSIGSVPPHVILTLIDELLEHRRNRAPSPAATADAVLGVIGQADLRVRSYLQIVAADLEQRADSYARELNADLAADNPIATALSEMAAALAKAAQP